MNTAKRTLSHLSDLHIGLRPLESKRSRAIFKRIANDLPKVLVSISGVCLLIAIIEIENVGTSNVSFHHRPEIV